MPSLSFEELLYRKHLADTQPSMGQDDQLTHQGLLKFLQPFHLRENLSEQLLQVWKFYEWHLRPLGGYFYPRYPLNEQFEAQYNIHTLSLPDRLIFWANDARGLQLLLACHLYLYPAYESHKISFSLPGADSFTRLEDGGFLVSGSVKNDESRQGKRPVILRITGNEIRPVELSAQASDLLQRSGVTNLYGFFQKGAQIFFGTWGEESNARLMQGDLQGEQLDNLMDITPPHVLSKGYDDLFVRGLRKDLFQVGVKLGINTTDPAVYFVDTGMGQIFTVPLNLGETELRLNYEEPAEFLRHNYTHQIYEMCDNRLATITSGRLGSILRIIDQSGTVFAKYFINLPNDHTPFADYPWLHTLKHPATPFLYIPDNDETIHRFHYNLDDNRLYVLKFKLPVSGEISALTATVDGFCVALTCNHRNVVLKVTHDLLCFQVYEKAMENTPISILLCEGDSIFGVTGSRFYPAGCNFSRYPHRLHLRSPNCSELIHIHAKGKEYERELALHVSRLQLKAFLHIFLEESPNHYQTLVQLSSLELETQNFRECTELCRKAIAAEKTALIPYRILAKALIAQNEFDEALQAISAYLDQAPDDKEMLLLQEDCRRKAQDSASERLAS